MEYKLRKVVNPDGTRIVTATDERDYAIGFEAHARFLNHYYALFSGKSERDLFDIKKEKDVAQVDKELENKVVEMFKEAIEKPHKRNFEL